MPMADSVLEALHEAVDAFGTLDAPGLQDAELHELVVAVQRERARLGAVAAALLGRWDARRIWAGDGSRSAAARLSRETACSPATASVEMRRARQQRDLPATMAAIGRGELSLDHIDLLGRANQAHRAAHLARDEAFLVEQCTRLRFAPATRVIGYWCQRVDAEVQVDDAAGQACDDIHLHAATTMGGTVVISGVLDPVGGSAVLDELNRLEHELYLAEQRDGTVRTAAARRAAALVVMAQRSATSPAGGRPPRPLFTVLLGDAAFTELCELANGTVITPRQLVPWLSAADLETILFDGPSTVVSVSHRRTFAGAVRRAVEVRDRHCQTPRGLRRARHQVRRRPHRPPQPGRRDEPVQRPAGVPHAQPPRRPPRSRRRPSSRPATHQAGRAARPNPVARDPRRRAGQRLVGRDRAHPAAGVGEEDAGHPRQAIRA